MKADRALAAIPIMAVTAYAATGDEERIRRPARRPMCPSRSR
jgi:hypothetical protein